MTDYTKNSNFTAKTGTTIEGADFDSEFDEIATAVASKEDKANKGANNGYCGLGAGGLVDPTDLPAATESAQGAVELATTAEAVTGTDTARAVTPAGVTAVLAQNGGLLQDIAGFSDPNGDYFLFWDDSAGQVNYCGVGTGLTLGAGTTLAFDGNASNLSSGTIPDARIAVTGVTQHQASLSIAETQIADGSLLARVADAETISGGWTFSAVANITRASQGKYVYLNGSGNTGGAITLSTAAESGVPANGDIWIQHSA